LERDGAENHLHRGVARSLIGPAADRPGYCRYRNQYGGIIEGRYRSYRR